MPGKIATVQPRLRRRAKSAVEARQLQQGRAAPAAGLKKARVRRNPTPPARAPQGLSRHEARHSRCPSAIGLMQKGNSAMTHLSNGTVVTDLDAHTDNADLTSYGYTIRHIETWHRDGTDQTFIAWDAPQITEADLPY